MAAVDRRAAVCSPLPSVVNLGYEDLTGVGRWPPTPNTCQVSGKLMSLALSRKWRPARFDQVIGQEHITRTLQAAVTADRVGHAYLFCGPRGTGKTTMARLLAKAVNCQAADPAATTPAPSATPSTRPASSI